jgi:isoquinoline 1-oxidoreductase subunit alpha
LYRAGHGVTNCLSSSRVRPRKVTVHPICAGFCTLAFPEGQRETVFLLRFPRSPLIKPADTFVMSEFVLTVNGIRHRFNADPGMPLLWALRDFLRLTGTKYGCGIGVCGACTVHQDGEPVRSCQVPLSTTAGKKYVTIEGLSADGDHPCQKAWVEEDVSQCGYCQAGMIMQAAALVRHRSAVSNGGIDAALSTHVCRCGTYQRIRRAIQRAAREVHAA